MSSKPVPLNQPFVTGKELDALRDVLEGGHLAGHGRYTALCQERLEQLTGAKKVLLTNSCTAALEMAAILAGIGPGDEVIMPSFTFVSTANAVVLRGAVPVFVDIRPDTLNIDERLIEAAITPRTKAISVVHYAGVGCEMNAILDIARRHGLIVMEDAAQALYASIDGRPLGSIGELGAISFHETKNVVSGEGGALLVNADHLVERAEIIWEKGTNRISFTRGEVEKYTWIDIGSSFLPSEFAAAVLWAQLERTREITQERLTLWQRYAEGLRPLQEAGCVTLPSPPQRAEHNAHIFFVLMENLAERTRALQALRAHGIGSAFHYVPLHSAPAGQRFGRVHGSMAVTDSVSSRLIRLPLFAGLPPEQVSRIVDEVHALFGKRRGGP
jgi:dTDP-4-amino-4,6-dideoxygalactose transaminase